eukprot:634851-Pelagomonas_calceolata.AAC.1
MQAMCGSAMQAGAARRVCKVKHMLARPVCTGEGKDKKGKGRNEQERKGSHSWTCLQEQLNRSKNKVPFY